MINKVETTHSQIDIFNLAVKLQINGQYFQARENYIKLLITEPNNSDALGNLAAVEYHIGDLNLALITIDRALQLDREHVNSHINRGLILHGLGRFAEAISSYENAISLQPDLPLVYFNLGLTYQKTRQLSRAQECYVLATQLNPNYGAAFNNLGNVLKVLKMPAEAETCYRNAVNNSPDDCIFIHNLANILRDSKKNLEASIYYKKIINNIEYINFQQGDYLANKAQICDWTDFDSETQILATLIRQKKKAAEPFPLLALYDDPQLHRTAAEVYTSNVLKSDCPPICHSRRIGEKIKIGYFSADFFNHATMHLLMDVINFHDRSIYETFAFSFSPKTDDDWQLHCKESFDQFIDVNEISDSEIAKLSRKLKIDIAIDLKGHTQDSRPGIFEARAAPIQVNYLGYPGTTGSFSIDYIISDDQIIPQSSEVFYTEKILRLPNSYQPNRKVSVQKRKTPTKDDYGLPSQSFIFSSFNDNYKICPDMFASWMNILLAVEGSVLWILVTNDTAMENLRRNALSAGVESSRLIFMPKVTLEQYHSRFQLADLMLDTFPYNAHTTASDALRSGLLVITRSGNTFASRVGASLLSAIDLPEMITTSYVDYERCAIRLARDANLISKLRAKLTSNLQSSHLFKPHEYTKNIEFLYQNIVNNSLKK